MSLHQQITNLLLTTRAGVLHAIADGPDAGHHADTLATAILDLIHRTPLLGTPAFLQDPLPGPNPQSPISNIQSPSITDHIPLPHDLPPALNTELATLCHDAGLTYNDIGFHENQPVVIATDPEGLREYYTLDALTARAEATQDDTGTLSPSKGRFDPDRWRPESARTANTLSSSLGRA